MFLRYYPFFLGHPVIPEYSFHSSHLFSFYFCAISCNNSYLVLKIADPIEIFYKYIASPTHFMPISHAE